MKKRVLVVDDALFMRNSIKGLLEKAGFEVCGEAATAPEAVEKYKELKPDLVTMDIIMPRIDELDGVGAIRKIMEFDSDAKIVVVSAVGEDPIVKEAMAAGAKGFLVKPFKVDNLIETLNSIFE